MNRPEATFENLPSMVAQLLEKVDRLEQKLEDALSQKPEVHEYMNVEQAIEFLQIAKSTLYNKVHKKEVPHFKFKGSLRFKRANLRTYLEEGKVDTVEQEQWRVDNLVDGLFQNKKRKR